MYLALYSPGGSIATGEGVGVVLGEEVRAKVGQGGHPESDGTCGVGTRVGSVVCVAMQANVCVCVCMHSWGCGREKFIVYVYAPCSIGIPCNSFPGPWSSLYLEKRNSFHTM